MVVAVVVFVAVVAVVAAVVEGPLAVALGSPKGPGSVGPLSKIVTMTTLCLEVWTRMQ